MAVPARLVGPRVEFLRFYRLICGCYPEAPGLW
jgi:hypothetical protein